MGKRHCRLSSSRKALQSHQLGVNNGTTNITQSSAMASRTMTSPSEIELTKTASPVTSHILDHPGSESPKFHLLSIAAELRNEIYELAFTCNDSEVNLLTTKPPSSALLQTCRQINNEAGQLFTEAVRDYYDTNNFCLILHRKRKRNAHRLLEEVAKTHDLQRIKNLHLRLISDRVTNPMLYMGGIWKMGCVVDVTRQQNGLLWDAKVAPTRNNRDAHRYLVPYRTSRNGSLENAFNVQCGRPLSSEPNMDELSNYLSGHFGFFPDILVNTQDQIEAMIGIILSMNAIKRQQKLQAKRTVVVARLTR